MGDQVEYTGWGRTTRSLATVSRPATAAEIVLDDDPRGHLGRGLGRSYGDAALNSGGRLWDLGELDRIRLDRQNRSVQVEGGVRLADLLSRLVPAGFFVPVSPGTKHVTIGGAIAADVHGKNHHRDGSIRHHLTSLTIRTGDGRVLVVSPGHELFEATVGGMGLTGLILEATLRLLPIDSTRMTVETKRTADLGQTMETLHQFDQRHRYTVAWLDLTASGAAMGRGLVDGGDHLDAGTTRPNTYGGGRSLRLRVPPGLPSGLINRTSVGAFNRLWYRRASVETTTTASIDSFFYPLDAVNEWNRLYGARGFLQHQFVVPFGAEETLESIVDLLAKSDAVPALAVLKRFGEGAGLLSFPISGWTLAVDVPARRNGLAGTLDEVDRRVMQGAGRIYLAKDARTRAEWIRVMYPELDKWREVANTYDPGRRFRSDLDRRLHLRGRP